jgi:hypothetical protein
MLEGGSALSSVTAAPSGSTLRSMRAIVSTVRYWGPLLAGFACLVAIQLVGPLVAWLLFILGFALIFDGVSASWARAGSVGDLTTHRQ